MDYLNSVWPPLELTEEEAEWCARYATDEKPGVLRRMYPVDILKTSFPDEIDSLRDSLTPSGRRCRVFGVTFSGLLAGFALKFSLLSGEQIIQELAPVPLLLNLTTNLTASFAPEIWAGGSEFLFNATTYQPLIYDPNIVLEGQQELLIETQWLGPDLSTEDQRYPLHLVFHCWEFPGVPSRVEKAHAVAQQERITRAAGQVAKPSGKAPTTVTRGPSGPRPPTGLSGKKGRGQ